MANFMDKADAFIEALDRNGIAFSPVDGDTAIVCNDCVAVISKHGDEVGVNFVNRLERLDYTVGFTEEDYLEYLIADEEENNAGDR